MPAPGDNTPDSTDADRQGFGSAAPTSHAPHQLRAPAPARNRSAGRHLGRVLLIIGGVAAAVLVLVSTGAIKLLGIHGGTPSAQASAQASLAATQMAADQQWASATCTNILDWKNEIHRDTTSLNFGFGALARIQDAIAATTRMSEQVEKLGLPPAANSARARAEIGQLRSDIESRVRNIEGAAGKVASGHLGAIGDLVSDLEDGTVVGTKVASELRHVVSVDLGISLVETRACRQLVGIPI
jgi:hypothetical protein